MSGEPCLRSLGRRSRSSGQRVWFMHDNLTFTRLPTQIDEVIEKAREISKTSPDGMLSARLVIGDKLVREVGFSLHGRPHFSDEDLETRGSWGHEMSKSALELEVDELRAKLCSLTERVRLSTVADRALEGDYEIRDGDIVTDGCITGRVHIGSDSEYHRPGPPWSGFERLFTVEEVTEIMRKIRE